MKKDKIIVVDFDNSGKEKSLLNESDDSMNLEKKTNRIEEESEEICLDEFYFIFKRNG